MRRPFWNHNRGQSLLNKLGLVDMETVRLVLNHGPTSVVTCTVVDTFSLAELESLLEFRHVFCVDCVSMSAKIMHLNKNMALWS